MGTPTTKNLGLVKAIHVGVNPPVNTKMLWYNINPNENIHYYFDVVDLSWKPLGSGAVGGVPVDYDFQDTNTVDLNQVGNSVSGVVKISAQTRNLITGLLDGLYASETVTYFYSFKLTGTILSASYINELGQQTTRNVNLASLLGQGKLKSASFNNSTYILRLTQFDDSVLSVDLSELKRVSTLNTTSIKLEGNGAANNPLKASAIISTQANNLLSVLPDGLFVSSGKGVGITKIKVFNIESVNHDLTALNQIVAYLNTTAPVELLEGEIGFINLIVDNQKVVQFAFGPGAGIYGIGGLAVSDWMFFEFKGVHVGECDDQAGVNGVFGVQNNIQWLTVYNKHIKAEVVNYVDSNVPGQVILKLSDSILEEIKAKTPAETLIDTMELFVGWKNDEAGGRLIKQKKDYTVGVTNNVYLRTGWLTYEYPSYLVDSDGNESVNYLNDEIPIRIGEINNLIVRVPGFKKIENYSPFLVISKYKHSYKKRSDLMESDGLYRCNTAGFKISLEDDNIRPSRIFLNSGEEQVIDFGQEYYFSKRITPKEIPKGVGLITYTGSDFYAGLEWLGTRGSKQRYYKRFNLVKFLSGIENSLGSKRFYRFRTFTYLEFRLGIIKEEEEIISKPLARLKMTLQVDVDCGPDVGDDKLKEYVIFPNLEKRRYPWGAKSSIKFQHI